MYTLERETENTESAERKARGLPAEKIGFDE